MSTGGAGASKKGDEEMKNMKRWRKTRPVTCKWSQVRGVSFWTRETVRLENLGIPSKSKRHDPDVKVTETY